jgi:hypothetical protein
MKVSRWIVPILIVLLIAVGLFAASLFAIPSVTVDFPVDEAPGTELIRTVAFVVNGVMCVDTARRACSTLEELPGVIRYVAYASHNRVEITFDSTRTNVEALREAIEGPVYDDESEKFLFHLFEVLEIDREQRRR